LLSLRITLPTTVAPDLFYDRATSKILVNCYHFENEHLIGFHVSGSADVPAGGPRDGRLPIQLRYFTADDLEPAAAEDWAEGRDQPLLWMMRTKSIETAALALPGDSLLGGVPCS
jgi:hypothetical protein